MSRPGHTMEESYLFTEMQSVYSTVPADWARGVVVNVQDCEFEPQ